MKPIVSTVSPCSIRGEEEECGEGGINIICLHYLLLELYDISLNVFSRSAHEVLGMV